MVKQGQKYYLISAANCDSKVVFEEKKNPQKHCGIPTSIYPTDYDSLYMDREEFDMKTKKNRDRDQNRATKILKYLGPKEKGDFGQLYAHNLQL